MRMPSLGFVLPHWVYWLTLLVFPLFAMIMARVEAQGYDPAVFRRIDQSIHGDSE